jgi:hypothetical protein
MSNMNLFCEFTIVIPQLSSFLSMTKAVLSTIEVVNLVTFNLANLFNFAMCVLPATVSRLSWSHGAMDGKELDDERYISCQGTWSPQCHSVN